MSHPIPRPLGVPVLGNIFDINPSNTWGSLKKLAEEHGEIFQITVLGHTIVFVASVALAEELCDEKRFRKYVGGPVVEIRAAVHDALFTAYDHEASWGIAHRIIAPLLQPDALVDKFAQTRDTASELIDLWKASADPVCPWRDLAKLDFETVAQTMFGQRRNDLSGPDHPMIKAMEDSTAEAMLRPTRPGILNWLLHRGKFNSSIKVMRDYAADVVQYRKEHPSDRQDLLWALMSGKDPQTGESLTESQVIDEVVSMYIGSSTAPCVLATALVLLLQNPDVIIKARKEIDVVVGAEGDLAHAHLSRLKYIEAIIRESLRLSFAAPGFNIEPIPGGGGGSTNESPVLLGGGKYEVAHNQAMIIVMAGVNRDPAVFEDPLVFRPERMMGDEFTRLPAGAKKWFGNGKRECIGKHHAWQWMMTVLTKMLREADFAMTDADYKLEQDGWFNFRPISFNVKVRARAV